MSEPLKFTSDVAWLRELSQMEHPFGADPPREIREKAQRLDEIAYKLECLTEMQKEYSVALLKLDACRKIVEGIISDGYIDEHRSEWADKDGRIAALISALGIEVDKYGDLPEPKP